jgi:hypothetical protein
MQLLAQSFSPSRRLTAPQLRLYRAFPRHGLFDLDQWSAINST